MCDKGLKRYRPLVVFNSCFHTPFRHALRCVFKSLPWLADHDVFRFSRAAVPNFGCVKDFKGYAKIKSCAILKNNYFIKTLKG